MKNYNTKIEETWKQFPGHENSHKISNLGRVKSIDRKIHTNGVEQSIRGKFTHVRFYKDNASVWIKSSRYTIWKIVAEVFPELSENKIKKQIKIGRFLPKPTLLDRQLIEFRLTNTKWYNLPPSMGAYQICKEGYVKSKNQILKPWVTQKGYTEVSLYKNGKRKNYKIHLIMRVVFMDANIDNTKVIHHKNRQAHDNRLENLLLMDKMEHDKLHAIERSRKNK